MQAKLFFIQKYLAKKFSLQNYFFDEENLSLTYYSLFIKIKKVEKCLEDA